MDLVALLRASTKDQLFQFNEHLYEQTDGVAMASLLRPLLAHVFMRFTEEILVHEDEMPSFYKRYFEDTLTIMLDTISAATFLQVLNDCHSSVKFTMEGESNGLLPFLGMQLLKRAPQIEIKVYIKPTNTGLFFHYRWCWLYFSEECDLLRAVCSPC